MTLITVPLGFLVLWAASGADWATLWTLTLDAGAAVAAEIGWVAGIYVPTLLGFYVLITGEQLGKGTNAGRLRRLLGGVAEFSFAALIPALLVLTAYTVSDPSRFGLLFVVIPAVGLLFFLTVQLGGFVVFETSVLLDDALDTRSRTLARMRALRPNSKRPAWLVIVGNLLLTIMVGAVTLGVGAGWAVLMHWEAVMFVATAAASLTLVGAFIAALRASRTVQSTIVAGAATALTVLWLATVVWRVQPPVIAVVVGVVAVAAGVSAWSPLRVLPDWSLAGAAARVGRRLALVTARRASRRVGQLRTELREKEDVEVRTRLGEAWTALRPR